MNILKGKRRKLLFVIPSASINGAVVVLMNFFEWMKQHKNDKEIEILVQWGKDDNQDAFFRNKLSGYGRVLFMQELSDAGRHELKSRLLSEPIECIFYNSIISVETQRFLQDLKAPQVFFVHEMERLMHLFRLEDNLDLYTKAGTHFIACSESVKTALKKVLKVTDGQVTVVHEFINTDHMMKELSEVEKKQSGSYGGLDLTALLDDKRKSFTVGLSGTFELRKSADLLPSLVREIKKRIKDAKVMWVGASPFNGELGTYDLVMNDLKQAGLTNDVILIPKGLGHYKYYKRFDVFVMLSREDPFPVVNLEMGALGVPMICFEHSGGSQEYAQIGGGVAVPFMDLGAIADQVKLFHDDPALLESYRSRTTRIINENFVVAIQAPKIYQVISTVSSQKKLAYENGF